MDSKRFFRLVEKMRERQKKYFRTRSQNALRECRFIESQVDAEIERVNKVLSEKNPELDFGTHYAPQTKKRDGYRNRLVFFCLCPIARCIKVLGNPLQVTYGLRETAPNPFLRTLRDA